MGKPPAKSISSHFLSLYPTGIFVILLVVAVGLRGFGNAERSLWIDELYSLRQAGGHAHPAKFTPGEVSSVDLTRKVVEKPFSAVFAAVLPDIHPPLYFIVLRLWRDVVGDTETAYRMLSLLLSAGVMVGLFVGTRIAYGPSVALWTCAIYAFASADLRYASEVRPYELLLLFGTWLFAAVAKIDRDGFRWWLGAGVILLLNGLAMTHYYFCGTAIGVACYAAFFMRGRDRLWLIGCIVAAGAAFVVYWGPSLLHQVQHLGNFGTFLLVENAAVGDTAIKRLLRAPGALLIEAPPRRQWLQLAGVVILVAPIFFLRRDRRLNLAYLWTVCTIGLIAAIDLLAGMHMLSFRRYYILATPTLCMLIAAVAGHFRWRGRWLVPAAVVVTCAAASPWTFRSSEMRFAASHSDIAAAIDADRRADDAIVFAGDVTSRRPGILAMVYERYSRALPPVVTMTPLPTPPKVAAELATHARFWLVTPDEPLTDAPLPAYVQRTSRRIPHLCQIYLFDREGR